MGPPSSHKNPERFLLRSSFHTEPEEPVRTWANPKIARQEGSPGLTTKSSFLANESPTNQIRECQALPKGSACAFIRGSI